MHLAYFFLNFHFLSASALTHTHTHTHTLFLLRSLIQYCLSTFPPQPSLPPPLLHYASKTFVFPVSFLFHHYSPSPDFSPSFFFFHPLSCLSVSSPPFSLPLLPGGSVSATGIRGQALNISHLVMPRGGHHPGFVVLTH